MPKYTSDQYRQIYDKLPEEIQRSIRSNDTVEKMWKIGRDHKLQIDQIGKLQDIILDIMMGILAVKDFRDAIVQELGVHVVEANYIVSEVDEELFKPIKEMMVKLYANEAPFKSIDGDIEKMPDLLDRDSLLQEIENPTESRVRKEEFGIPEVRGAKFVNKTKPLEPLSTSQTVEEYHDELTGESRDFPEDKEAETPESDSEFEKSKKRILESIISAKLNNITLMPKVGGVFGQEKTETSKPEEAVSKREEGPEKELNNNIEDKEVYATKQKPTDPPLSEQINVSNQKPKIEMAKPTQTQASDPYREPIE